MAAVVHSFFNKLDSAIQLRSNAKEVAPPPPPQFQSQSLKGDEHLRKEKFTIAAEDLASVSQYAKIMKLVRHKAVMLSESERIKSDIQEQTQDIQDARTYLLTLKEL
ncbi:hypothetical protein ACFE04_020948 [Oxalis oulophora]